MYEWSNDIRLSTLCAYGGDNILVFETPYERSGRSISDERAEVYLRNNTDATILNVDGFPVANSIERVVFFKNGETVVIDSPEMISVGEGNTKRDVYHYLKPGGPSPTLRLGITVHKGVGSWSSLPHGFELNTEPGFEEVFFYILNGGSERGIQVGKGVWFDNERIDSVWQVRDRTFGTIPMGYHPVVGEPGVQVSYIWAYLAKKKEWEKI